MLTTLKPIVQKAKRVFFDTEFYERDGFVRLVSIGLVDHKDRELYVVSHDVDDIKELAKYDADPFVYENILCDEALYPKDMNVIRTESKEHLQETIEDFCGENPIFIAYCSAYDSVALRSPFGRMVDCPEGWPYAINELAIAFALAGQKKSDFPPLPNEMPKHNALADARNVSRIWNEMVKAASLGKYGNKSQSVLDVLFCEPR